MSITYEEALGTLEAMFGAPWTRETLDAVLRHFQGHMENTVESILQHGEGDPAALVKKLKGGDLGSTIRMDEEIARQMAVEGRTRTQDYSNSAATATTNAKKGRGTPVVLPPDFLRIPTGSGALTGSTTADDEALARMLQDELFSQELANNPEFAHLARGRPRTVGGRPTNQAALVGEPPVRHGGAKRTGDDGSNFMEKVADMGEITKRRLQLFAAQFNAKVSGLKTAHASTGGAGGSSGVAERQGLLNDEEGEEGMEFAFVGAKKTL